MNNIILNQNLEVLSSALERYNHLIATDEKSNTIHISLKYEGTEIIDELIDDTRESLRDAVIESGFFKGKLTVNDDTEPATISGNAEMELPSADFVQITTDNVDKMLEEIRTTLDMIMQENDTDENHNPNEIYNEVNLVKS